MVTNYNLQFIFLIIHYAYSVLIAQVMHDLYFNGQMIKGNHITSKQYDCIFIFDSTSHAQTVFLVR